MATRILIAPSQAVGFRRVHPLSRPQTSPATHLIRTILNVSPRTVQKHLERIYARLGVENRHAAVAMIRSLNESDTSRTAPSRA